MDSANTNSIKQHSLGDLTSAILLTLALLGRAICSIWRQCPQQSLKRYPRTVCRSRDTELPTSASLCDAPALGLTG